MPDNHVGKSDEATLNGHVDLAAMQADDVLVDIVLRAAEDGSEKPFGLNTDPAGHRLGEVLLSWRHEIDSQPFPQLVTVAQASVALAAARQIRRPPTRLLPLAAAAACVVIACSGVALTAHSATPDSPLWGVSKVLYSERAESVTAAAIVTKEFDDTRRALASGHIDQARKALANATSTLASVRPEDGHQDLTIQHDMLMNELAHSAPPGPAPGSVPSLGHPQGPLPAQPVPSPHTPDPGIPVPPDTKPATPDPPTPAPPTTQTPTPDSATPAPRAPEPPQHRPPHHRPPHDKPPRDDPPHHRPPHHNPPADGSTSPAFRP